MTVTLARRAYQAAAVIAVGAAILFGREAVLKQREAANRNLIRAQLFQLQLALANYSEFYGSPPPFSTAATDGGEGLSWRVLILPYCGHQELYAKFSLNESWNSESNRPLIVAMPRNLFAHPHVSEENKTCYMAIQRGRGWQYSFPGRENSRDRAGVFPSLCVASKCIEWTRPGDLDVDLIATNLPEFIGFRHLGSEHVLPCICNDGSAISIDAVAAAAVASP